jgi:hypothetical protein
MGSEDAHLRGRQEPGADGSCEPDTVTERSRSMSFVTASDGTEIFYKDWGRGRPDDIWVKGPQPSVDLLAFAQSVDR